MRGRGGSAIDARTTRHTGYAVSQKKRKRIEECFGWLKTSRLRANFVIGAPNGPLDLYSRDRRLQPGRIRNLAAAGPPERRADQCARRSVQAASGPAKTPKNKLFAHYERRKVERKSATNHFFRSLLKSNS